MISQQARQRKPVILYELNEVPWRVFDWYVRRRPDSNLAAILKTSGCYTTRTHDTGELHPWSTWPTLHRGVYNTTHKIFFLNQDLQCASDYPPVWETLVKQGVKVGVFGSLQSWPVPADRDEYCFYIPDTFSQTPETYPEQYSAFQAINLRQTKADTATAQQITLNSNVIVDLLKLPLIGVKLRTFFALAKHLVNEKRNPLYRTRRAMMQAPLAFDIFLDVYKKTRPEFSTFFTNHVAGIMHRYWRYAFPEDFGVTLQTPACFFRQGSLLVAMDIADSQVGMLKKIVDKEGGQLIIASSMGQEAIDRGKYFGELRLTHTAKLMSAIGFHYPCQDLLAMQPDFNFKFESTEHASEFVRLATRLHTQSGTPLWKRVHQEKNTVNMGMESYEETVTSGEILFSDVAGDRVIKLADLGIDIIERDQGTGYHQALGSMIWYGNSHRTDQQRSEIETAHVRGMILEEFQGPA